MKRLEPTNFSWNECYIRQLTISGGQAVVADVEVLVRLRLLWLCRVVGADARVNRAGDGGQDGCWRCQGWDGGLCCNHVSDFRWGLLRFRFFFYGFLLLLLPLLLRLPPQLLSLALDGRHPVPYGLGHKLEVCLAHETKHNLHNTTQMVRAQHEHVYKSWSMMHCCDMQTIYAGLLHLMTWSCKLCHQEFFDVLTVFVL